MNRKVHIILGKGQMVLLGRFSFLCLLDIDVDLLLDWAIFTQCSVQPI